MSGRGGKDLVMEKVKFNNVYDLVVNGLLLSDQGGQVVFLPGNVGFEKVEAELKTVKSITLLDEKENPIQVRTDLVYAGRLTKDIAHESGMVMVAEFRLPDVREQLAVVEAKLDYVAMMTDVEMEV